MAGKTGRVITLVGCVLVAVQAFKIIVAAPQREACGTVIKFTKLPSLWCMANAALIAQLFLMHVIFLVARFTSRRCVLQHLDRGCIEMALLTFQVSVQIIQLKGNLIVVKVCTVGFNPIVAVTASISKQGDMVDHKIWMHLLMASYAGILIKSGKPLDMAVFALNIPFPRDTAVGLKRKAHQFMREIPLQKFCQTCLWTTMIGMAVTAVEIIHFCHHRAMQ